MTPGGRPAERRVIVGTAGHIDHGKTRLVLALTGIDCDRWVEEKERGITIDLGFAHLESGDLQIGFVDVPGHERFLNNALAGLGGIRIMLLVVAADEGVKPQTREHLDICGLLEIPLAIVALTKSDLVAPDLLELARLEVEELLAPTRFAGAPMFEVSSETGDGVAELTEALLALANEAAVPGDDDRPARLPVDRAFQLKGLGNVVTGTLAGGAIAAGETLALLPAGGTARVRSIQVHGAARERAEAGERTALQLTGPELAELRRGAELVTPDAFVTTTSLAVECALLPDAPKPVEGWLEVRFHLYSSEVVGRLRPLGGAVIEPGETGVAELRLAHPLVAARGDRFIVRRPSPQATIGGGRVLDPEWRRRRGRSLERAVAALGGERPDVLRLWVRDAGEAGIDSAALARRLGVRPSRIEGDLEAMTGEQLLLEVPAAGDRPRRWITPAAFRRVQQRAERVLADYFRRDRLARGIPKAEAVRRILPGRAAALADTYLGWLEAQGVLSVSANLVNLPGRSAELTDDESKLAASIRSGVEQGGLTPPAPAELRDRLGVKPQIFDGVLRYLIERGDLVKLPGGLVLSSAAVSALRQTLLDSDWDRFAVAQFKERFGLTRKWAIPLLEHLDSVGATRRLGDERQVVRAPKPAGEVAP